MALLDERADQIEMRLQVITEAREVELMLENGDSAERDGGSGGRSADIGGRGSASGTHDATSPSSPSAADNYFAWAPPIAKAYRSLY
jgi:hypothetical protein